VLNHRGSPQLVRLLTTLRRQLPDSPLVVHHDRFRAELPFSELEHLGNVHLLRSERPVLWGDFSLLEAYWRSMTWMVENLEFDWLMLLSGQDYPIKPLNGFHEYLAGINADAVVDAVPIDDIAVASDRRDRFRRYMYQYQPAQTTWLGRHLPERGWNFLRISTSPAADVFNNVQRHVQIYKFPDHMPWRVGRRAVATPFTEAQPCWYGSAWLSLSRHATEYLVASTYSKPDLVSYYEQTIIPDESATATIICNASELHVERRQLHYLRWSHRRSSHPDVLETKDLPALIESPAYFARKFDLDRDAGVLSRLDALIENPALAAEASDWGPGVER
jgi:hypothetical protein